MSKPMSFRKEMLLKGAMENGDLNRLFDKIETSDEQMIAMICDLNDPIGLIWAQRNDPFCNDNPDIDMWMYALNLDYLKEVLSKCGFEKMAEHLLPGVRQAVIMADGRPSLLEFMKTTAGGYSTAVAEGLHRKKKP